MTEVFPANSVAIELVRRMRDTRVFLRMAAIQLRRIAERAPEIASELRHMSEQLEREVKDLACTDADCGFSVDFQADQKT